MLVEGSLVATVFAWIGIVLGGLLLWFAVVLRAIKHVYQRPIPAVAARFLNNPLRRWVQPPQRVVDWIGIGEGMTALEIGPGPGTFTFEAAKRLGEQGRLYVIDIAPRLIADLQRQLQARGITNVTAKVASAYELPFPDTTFDRILMMSVLGEIPDEVRALREVRRVLKDSGQLAIGELLVDPDYPRQKTVIQRCARADFKLVSRHGGLMHYVLNFAKAA